MDGDQLADKLKDLRLGIKTDMVERAEVDADWFRNIWRSPYAIKRNKEEYLKRVYWIIEGRRPTARIETIIV